MPLQWVMGFQLNQFNQPTNSIDSIKFINNKKDKQQTQ